MAELVTVTNLNKVFNPGRHSEVRAVNNVSLTMTPAEVLLIMGPSGSGKTTLLTLIGGLLQATSGTIQIQNTEITKLNRPQAANFRRRHIGFIFQSFNLLKNLSALENVMIASFTGNHSRAKAIQLLEQLGLEERLNFLPNDLSGGERQRVAIARALINDPQLILADEPTANLDKHIGHEVMQLLCSIACRDNKGVIIVSHDERIKDVAHRIIYIEDGKLTKEEKGRHNEVCQMPH